MAVRVSGFSVQTLGLAFIASGNICSQYNVVSLQGAHFELTPETFRIVCINTAVMANVIY